MSRLRSQKVLLNISRLTARHGKSRRAFGLFEIIFVKRAAKRLHTATRSKSNKNTAVQSLKQIEKEKQKQHAQDAAKW